MAEHTEGVPDMSEKEGGKIENLHQLFDLLQEKFGSHAHLFKGELKRTAGYREPGGMIRDTDADESNIAELLKNINITQEIISQVNDAIENRVQKMKDEIEGVKNRAGMEKYMKSCQDVINTLGDDRLVMSSDGVISFEKKEPTAN